MCRPVSGSSHRFSPMNFSSFGVTKTFTAVSILACCNKIYVAQFTSQQLFPGCINLRTGLPHKGWCGNWAIYLMTFVVLQGSFEPDLLELCRDVPFYCFLTHVSDNTLQLYACIPKSLCRQNEAAAQVREDWATDSPKPIAKTRQIIQGTVWVNVTLLLERHVWQTCPSTIFKSSISASLHLSKSWLSLQVSFIEKLLFL